MYLDAGTDYFFAGICVPFVFVFQNLLQHLVIFFHSWKACSYYIKRSTHFNFPNGVPQSGLKN